jgi:hypothetical protein
VRHRIFSFAALLSLLICIATIVLWVRSYWRYDTFYWKYWSSEAEMIWWEHSEMGQLIFGCSKRGTDTANTSGTCPECGSPITIPT